VSGQKSKSVCIPYVPCGSNRFHPTLGCWYLLLVHRSRLRRPCVCSGCGAAHINAVKPQHSITTLPSKSSPFFLLFPRDSEYSDLSTATSHHSIMVYKDQFKGKYTLLPLSTPNLDTDTNFSSRQQSRLRGRQADHIVSQTLPRHRRGEATHWPYMRRQGLRVRP
jgi:hypothetical protein